MSQIRKIQSQQIISGYPMMTTSEICDCLAALGINVPPDDLAKPNAALTQFIWTGLLETLKGCPVEMFEQPKQTLLGMMQYKESYAEGLHMLMFYRHCRELALVCNITNFSIADITRPEPTRLRAVLSGVMNFAKFWDERKAFYNAQQERPRQAAEKANALRFKLNEIEASIKNITERNAADTPLLEAAQARNQQVCKELHEKYTTQVEISKEVQALKKERGEILEDLTSKKEELSTIEKQKIQARSRLVASPDRLRRDLNEKSVELAASKEQHASLLKAKSEHTKRLEIVKDLTVMLKELVELKGSHRELKAATELAKRKESTLTANVEKAKIQSQDLATRIEQLNYRLKYARDSFERQNEHFKSISELSSKKVEALKVEYDIRSRERHVWENERDNLLKEQKEVEAEMAAYVARTEQEINQLVQEYYAMRKQAEDYMNTMTVKLGLQLKV